VHFLAPVKAGDRVRLRVALVEVEQKRGVVLKTSNTVEIEGSDKPALIAEIVGADNTQRICLRRGNTRRKR
jgi:acyl dehydratase